MLTSSVGDPVDAGNGDDAGGGLGPVSVEAWQVDRRVERQAEVWVAGETNLERGKEKGHLMGGRERERERERERVRKEGREGRREREREGGREREREGGRKGERENGLRVRNWKYSGEINFVGAVHAIKVCFVVAEIVKGGVPHSGGVDEAV